jgi:signal transduction histidine kinase
MLSDPDSEARTFEVGVQTRDGKMIPSEFHIALLPTDDGGFRGTAGIIRDIEERKEREERLEQFASVVSHDLRGPLNVILGRVELANERTEMSELDTIAEAAERMDGLIEDLLTLAQQGQTVGELHDVSLSSVAEQAWQSIDTADATLDSWATLTLTADSDRLRELLENLFRNAIEHGRDDVTITVGRLEGGNGFYVADDGTGIPAERHSEVFEHGYTTDERGTGFGLSIVERIAEAHGWTASVTESEDGGARFEFYTD